MQPAEQLIVFISIVDIEERHLARLFLHRHKVEIQDLVGIDHAGTVGRLDRHHTGLGDLENAIPEEEMVICIIPAPEVRLDDGQILQGGEPDLIRPVYGIGQLLIVVFRMSLDVLQQISGAMGGDGILIDESHHIVTDVAEGISLLLGVRSDSVVSGGPEEGIELLIVDVIGPAGLAPFLIPESKGSGELHQVIEEPPGILIFRPSETHEEILGILARLPSLVLESGQL